MAKVKKTPARTSKRVGRKTDLSKVKTAIKNQVETPDNGKLPETEKQMIQIIPAAMAVDVASLCKSASIGIDPITAAVILTIVEVYKQKGITTTLADIKEIIGTVMNSKEYQPFINAPTR